MSEPKIAVRSDPDLPEKKVRSAAAVPSVEVWTVWGWLGLSFLLVGGCDFLLTWVPTDFGNPEWEFATLTASLDGLPVPTLGLAGLLSAAWASQRRWLAGAVLLCAACFLLIVLAGLVLWALSVPLALQSVPAELTVGLKRALIKTSAQGVAYPVILGYLVWRSWGIVRGQG